MNKAESADRILSALIISLLVTGIVYGAVFGVFYLTADEVKCGSVGPIPYCSGVYKSSDVQLSQEVNMSRTCYQNGEEVNCSQISDDFKEVSEKYRLLETDRMSKHLQEDGSYPVSSFTEEVQEEVKKNTVSFEEQVQKIEENTYLSEREAELYILIEKADISIPEAANKIGISKGNAYGKRGDIKQKIEKAEKTAELSI